MLISILLLAFVNPIILTYFSKDICEVCNDLTIPVAKSSVRYRRKEMKIIRFVWRNFNPLLSHGVREFIKLFTVFWSVSRWSLCYRSSKTINSIFPKKNPMSMVRIVFLLVWIWAIYSILVSTVLLYQFHELDERLLKK